MGLCRCEKKDTKDFRLSAGNLTETSKKSLGNECNRTQMSALEEHNNSLLHKEALRLQSASKDKNMARQDKPVYVKGYCLTNSIIEAAMSQTVRSILEATLRRESHAAEFIQAIQEVVQALERVIGRNSQLLTLV